MTSDSTAHVTGPGPTEKAETKVTMAMMERREMLLLIPMARRTEAITMVPDEPRRMALEPTRSYSDQYDAGYDDEVIPVPRKPE